MRDQSVSTNYVGTLAGWQPGRLTAWQPGSLAAWQPGSLAAWQPGSLASWQPGGLAGTPVGGALDVPKLERGGSVKKLGPFSKQKNIFGKAPVSCAKWERFERDAFW